MRASAIERLPRRKWANGPDQAMAGFRYVGLFSDLETPRPAELRDALSILAAAGPHTRVALTPRAGKRLWRYDPATRVPVHELPDDIADNDRASVMEYIRHRAGHRHPLEVHVSRRHLAFDVDHGLSDGSFVLDLASALYALRDGRTTPWVTERDARLALPRALIRTFAFHPSRTRAMWNCAADLRSAESEASDAIGGGDYVAWSPSPAVLVTQVSARAESAVDEWRREKAGRPGSGAAWLYIVRQALYSAGLLMTDRVMVAFDCRRYLTPRNAANGNFIIGLELPFAEDDTLSALATRTRSCIDSAAPLAAMGALSTRALIRGGRQAVSPSGWNIGAPASLMYTDMGNITSVDDLPWTGESSLAGLLDPGGPTSITVFSSRIGSTRSISISFHDNVHDRGIIEKAAEHLKVPTQFLT